jgi:hypothetical protein
LFVAAQHVQAFQPNTSRDALSSASRGIDMHAHANDRRAFVTVGIAAASSLLLPQVVPAHAADATSVDYKAVAKDIVDLVDKNPDWGPSKLTSLDVPTEMRN